MQSYRGNNPLAVCMLALWAALAFQNPAQAADEFTPNYQEWWNRNDLKSEGAPVPNPVQQGSGVPMDYVIYDVVSSGGSATRTPPLRLNADILDKNNHYNLQPTTEPKPQQNFVREPLYAPTAQETFTGNAPSVLFPKLPSNAAAPVSSPSMPLPSASDAPPKKAAIGNLSSWVVTKNDPAQSAPRLPTAVWNPTATSAQEAVGKPASYQPVTQSSGQQPRSAARVNRTAPSPPVDDRTEEFAQILLGIAVSAAIGAATSRIGSSRAAPAYRGRSGHPCSYWTSHQSVCWSVR